MISATHLHAMAVHFPIALLLTGFLIELFSLIRNNKTSGWLSFILLILGTLGAVVSYFSGDAAGEGMEEGTLAAAIELHEQAALFAFLLSVATSVVYIFYYLKKSRMKWLRIMGILCFTLTVAALARTGYLGGELVYKHGAGVQLQLPDFNKE